MRQELHVVLTTCAAELQVPRAKNVVKRVRCIQNNTLFTKYLKRLTIEMVKRVTVLINSFNKKIRSTSTNVTQTNIVWKGIQDSAV